MTERAHEGSAAIHVGPASRSNWAADAVRAAGGSLSPAATARGIVWASSGDVEDLAATLSRARRAEWVHTAYSGIDAFAHLIDRRWTWTSGKGALAVPVAEHALSLILAALRHLPALARSTHWEEIEPKTLFGARVVIVGAGSVATTLAALLQPFGCDVRLLGRPRALDRGKTDGASELRECLPLADVLVLAAPLTPATKGMIGIAELRAMRRSAVLVNVARGALLQTDELAQALDAEEIHAAALDVTDPEPLPDGHRLYSHARCLVTCHTAVTETSGRGLLAPRISDNVTRFLRGDPLLGVVDPDLHY